MNSRKSALFLDRDGVINQRIVGGYVRKPSELILNPNVIKALATFRQHFDNIFIVTNQQGVGKGIVTQNEVDAVHNHLRRLLRDHNVDVDAIYCCPHLASEHCGCRKPNIGMAEQAQRDFPNINFQNSVMVGDSLSDVQFGKTAGMSTVFIDLPINNSPDEARTLADVVCNSLYDYALGLVQSAEL